MEHGYAEREKRNRNLPLLSVLSCFPEINAFDDSRDASAIFHWTVQNIRMFFPPLFSVWSPHSTRCCVSGTHLSDTNPDRVSVKHVCAATYAPARPAISHRESCVSTGDDTATLSDPRSSVKLIAILLTYSWYTRACQMLRAFNVWRIAKRLIAQTRLSSAQGISFGYLPIKERRGARVRARHVAMITLRLCVGRLLLMMVHRRLLVVRPAVLLQPGLR